MTYLEKEEKLQNMVNNGQLMEAFEKYYAENVELIEATGETFSGKNEGRKHEQEFLEKVKEFHGAGVNRITSNENEKTTMTESWMDLTFKEGGRVKMEQVAVKQWDADQVVRERFYYNPG